MKVRELPPSTVLGADYRYAQLAELIEGAVNNADEIFCSKEDTEGPTKETIHIFYTSPTRHGETFGKTLSGRDLAKTLVNRLECPDIVQAPPKPEHRKDWVRGWQINRGAGPHGTIVVAWATWVPRC